MNFKNSLVKLCQTVLKRPIPKFIHHTSRSFVQTTASADNRNVVPLHELLTRRERLINQFEKYIPKLTRQQSKHIVIIPAAEVQYMSYHVPYPFHQDSSFYYLTGLNEPNGILVALLSFKPSDHGFSDLVAHYSYHLFVEIRNRKAIQWDGPTLGIAGASLLTGIPTVHSRSDFEKFLTDQFPSASSHDPTYLWFNGLSNTNASQRPPTSRSVLADVLNCRQYFEPYLAGYHSPDHLIDQVRVKKSQFEIDLLTQACQITASALKSTMKLAYPGILEADLHNRFEFEVRCRGASLSYPPVIGGGERATIIHYLTNNGCVNDGELVLMDVGSRVGGYTADMTRTWPVNGQFNPIQRILYEILIEVQKSCVLSASPEHSLTDLYELMLKEMRKHLVGENILGQDSSIGIVRQICPHHVGHYLGLDVHDTPTISNSRKLEPGFVFPIEPGFYFRPELKCHGIRDEFINIGLRLEDDYAMLEDGNVTCLTNQMPSQTADIQALIGSGLKTLHNDDNGNDEYDVFETPVRTG